MDAQPTQPLDESGDLPEVLVEESRISLRRSLLKMLLTAVAVVFSVWLIHATQLREVVSDIQLWKERLASAGGWGPALFALGVGLLIAAGLPRLLTTALAGALFGFSLGFPVAWVASGLGAYLNFLLVRWGARDGVQRVLKIPPRVRAALEHPTFFSVVLLRQLPVWGLAVNAGLALTHLRHRVYLAGTLCGILPSTLIVALIGSGMGKASLEESLRNLGWAMALMALFAAGLWRMRKRLRPAPAPTGSR